MPLPEKPAYGAACNGCGLCCMAEPCVVAKATLGVDEGACPALEIEGGRAWCGLLRNAHKHIAGLSERPWVDEVFREMLMETGAWRGLCDSEAA